MKSMLAQVTSIEGKASDVRQARATIVSNGGFGEDWGNPRSAPYECLFRLSGKPVALRVSGPIFIEDGETVRVVGRHNSNGVFEALAYYNRSSGVSGTSDEASVRRLFAIGFAVICGLGVMMFSAAPLMSRFVRDDHVLADSILGVCAVFGLPLVLIGWVMFARYRSGVRTIERLLNGE